jgi:hypothetical protein
MTIPLTSYVKIKDNYCLGYLGLVEDYLKELLLMRPMIENEYPGLKLYIAYNDKLSHIVRAHDLAIPYSMLASRLEEFAYYREIKHDLLDPITTPAKLILKECRH